MAQSVGWIVNGVGRQVDRERQRSLLYVLREELGLTGARYGCGEGECGACTVLVDGDPVRACQIKVGEVREGAVIITVEGLAAPGELHPVQRAFVEVEAMQCGFCTPGMIMSTVALLAKNPRPDEAAIRAAMDGNICRCCTYPRILRAVEQAAQAMRAGEAAAPATDGVRPSPWRPETAARPAAPWDTVRPRQRRYFAELGDGLVVILPPPRPPARARARGPWFPNGGAWLHVGAGGVVTAFTGKVDVGQGNRTALALLVAEELGAPLEAVRLVMGDTDFTPFDVGTFGSRSMADAGTYLRSVAARAREVLLGLASERLSVDRGALVVDGGRVRAREGAQAIGLGELVAGLRRVERASLEPPPTPATAWCTAGDPSPKRHPVEIVTAARRYPSDLTRPGMLHAKILRPPAFGARLRRVDVKAARKMPGVTVLHEGSFVGVAAPDPFAARAAVEAMRAEWDLSPQPSERQLEAHLRSHPIEVEGFFGAFHHEVGRVDDALAAAPVRLDATYTTAYIAHAPLEVRVALAEWEGDRLTVWTGTQQPFGVRSELAEALRVPEADVRVIVPDTGGGFGGKHAGETAIAAARLARAAGRPVRWLWTREEEFTWAYFRPAAVIDVRAGAREDGTLAAWEFKNYNSGSAGILPPYAIPAQRIDHQPEDSPLDQGPYRALAATANHFARESLVDELAHRVGVDPVELRLRQASDARLGAVLRAVAERAGWAARQRVPGRGFGIAAGLEKEGRVATFVEVRVPADGRVEIVRIVTGFECGAIVEPDNLANQIEGATVMGLGGALFEAIHFDEGRILNPRFSAYRVPRFRDVPPIEVLLVDRKDLPSAGAGETPIVAVAPALASAIFDASGRRLRTLPLCPDGVVR